MALGGLVGTGLGYGAGVLLKKDPAKLSGIGGGLGALVGEFTGIRHGVKRHGEYLNNVYSEKQAAMNELLESGVSFDEAVEMVKEANNHAARAWLLGPGAQEAAIAKDHGKDLDEGVLDRHFKGNREDTINGLKAGLKTGAKAAVPGALLGGLIPLAVHLKNKGTGSILNKALLGAGVGGYAGLLGGYTVGAAKNLNQSINSRGERLNKHYAEKKAAYDELIAQGLDYESAVAAIQDSTE